MKHAMTLFLAVIGSSAALLACSGEDQGTTLGDGGPDTGLDPDASGAVCGNGIVEPPELCDEGADNGAYGRCATTCAGPGQYCGDGVLQADLEVCDDGPRNGDYGACSYACNGPGERCGNGFIETELEACDDAEKNGSYGFCASNCEGPADGCGDGVVTAPFESCDDGAANGQPGACPSDCTPTPGCGDGTLVVPEACDEGAANGVYGHCASDCSGPGARCGDGERDLKREACDDGERNGTYGHCKTDCSGLGAHCGDGDTVSPEVCDDGTRNGLDGSCNINCTGQTNTWLADPAELDGLGKMANACTDDDLLSKYMHYRVRLRGDGTAANPGFLSVGPGPGESMPASRRQPSDNCAGYWAFESCPRPDLPDAKGIYKWGDGTVWHGEYLGVLALEYAMFTDLGLSTAETLSDLAYALNAVDRVDEKAETFFPGATPVRDGLFVRDDVPLDFYLKDGAYRFPRDGDQSGYECVSADIICTPPKIDDGSFTSQDQTIALIFGLGLVNRFIPEGLEVRGVRLAPDARQKVHRLVWFLRDHGWKVKDPEGNSPPDAWGGNAIGFSNAMAKVANAVVGDELGVDDYRNFASRTAGEASWVGLQAIWELTHGYNRSHALKLAAVNAVWDEDKMPKMAMGDGKDYYALAYALINHKTLGGPWSDWRIESLLQSAPCSGPCRGATCAVEAPGWMGESRILDAPDRVGSRHYQGEFNGMDYMATYAAYYLYRNGRYTHERPSTAPTECRSYVGLSQILASGASDGQVYDPNHPCAVAVDFDQKFCRRPFGNWLADATEKKVTLWAGGGRWDCTPGGTCVIHPDDDENTNGDDLILGTSGDDDLSGDSGNDCIVGFGGNDVLKGNQGFDELYGGEGNDELYGEGSFIALDGEADVLFGGPGDDYLDAGPGKDELYGEEGNDELDAGSGDDYLLGGPGNDVLIGNTGEDSLLGGDGDDSLDGGWGGDTMWGGPGRDKLDGDLGEDSLDGGTGPDFLRGGAGDDGLASGDDWGTNQLDHDRLCGNGGDDTLWGGWDQDECLGGGWFLGGTDTVNGCEDGSADSGECDKGAFDAW